MGITPERKKSAAVGAALALLGTSVFVYGTYLLPLPREGRLFAGLLLFIFGILLAASAVTIFLLPAAYEYFESGTS